MTPETTSPPDFRTHYEETHLRLRGALTELVLSAGGDPARPQEIARQFGIDKTLAWKVSKLITGEDSFASVRHMPGGTGIEILLAKLAEAEAPAARLEAVREAREAYDHMVEVHAGDRAHLELMLSSMAPASVRTPRLEASRKLAFQGNSATWGVQARLRHTTQLLAPNEHDPLRVDIATISGFLDFRRLRPTAWPMAHLQSYGDSDAGSPQLPLDPNVGDGPALLPEFCSSPVPEIRAIPDGTGMLYELPEGPVGNSRAVTCTLGWMRKSFAASYARVDDDDPEDDPRVEHIAFMDTPVEEVQFDVFFHHELPFAEVPRAAIYSLMEGRPQFPISSQRRYRMELPMEVQRLGSRPPVVTTPEMPRHNELLDFSCGRMGRNLADFTGYRLKLRYPPTPTLIVLYHPLPREPRAE